jgi:hypothetical protein
VHDQLRLSSPTPFLQISQLESTPCKCLLYLYQLLLMTALEDERLLHDSVIMRYLVYEPSHMHLLSIDADWELEGHAICRVLDSRCYGRVYRAMSYSHHLDTPYDMVC